MQSRNLRLIKVAARWIVILLAVVVIAYSIFLIVIGVPGMRVMAVPEGDPMATPERTFSPFPLAVVPLLAALVIIGGTLSKNIRVAWISLIVLAVFGFLTIFSAGFVYLAAALVLLVMLSIYRFT